MKKLLLLSLLVICSSLGYTQSSETGLVLDVRSGFAFPLGEFSDNSYAQVGFTSSLEFGYLFNGKIGPALKLGYFENAADETAISKDAGIPIHVKEPYTNVFIGGGVIGQLPISERVAFTGKLMMGVLNSTVPAMETVIFNPYLGQYFYFSFAETTANAFAFSPGVGFRFYVGKILTFSVETEMITATPEYYISELEEYDKQDITVFNISGGVGLKF